MRSETILGQLLEAHRRIAENKNAYETNDMPGAASSLASALQSIEAAIESYSYGMYARGCAEGRKSEQERFEAQKKREEAEATNRAMEAMLKEADHA